MRTRTYSELQELKTFEKRYDYLALKSSVGIPTFGFDRWINQALYHSREWRDVRHHVIARDRGCDLGLDGYEIYDKVYVHHMNPILLEDLIEGDCDIFDPEFLVSVTHRTHNAIHYGDKNLLPKAYSPRKPNDTKLW